MAKSFIHNYVSKGNNFYDKDFCNYTSSLVISIIYDFNAKKEKEILDKLYEMYMDKFFSVYIISRKEFEHFIKTMLPIYIKSMK